MQALTLTIAVLCATLLAVALPLLLTRGRRPEPLPKEWRLMLRPVFSIHERRLYQQLREAFPAHVILCKLALVRFTHSSDPARVQYWHDLIGALNVTFAICNAHGRVLAAIDIEGPRGGSRRATRIKTGVLNACRVRYLCFMVDDLPSTEELRRAVLHDDGGPDTVPRVRDATASRKLEEARSSLHSAVRKQREHRDSVQWDDSRQFAREDATLAPDSFFAPDSRQEAMSDSSGFAPLRAQMRGADQEIVGVVVDDGPGRRA
jgi:hypothetical protein